MYTRLLTFLSLSFFFVASAFSIANWSWVQVNNFPSNGLERMFSFEIDDLIYVGGGREIGGINSPHMWSYDLPTDTWTQLADFPGELRRNAFGFRGGAYGFMGTGYNGVEHLADFWKYDSTTDTWVQLPDFPGGARSHAVAISGDEKAYVLAGGISSQNQFYNDLWEFDVLTETWTLIGNFLGDGRWRAYGWRIGQKIFLGGGIGAADVSMSDLHSFNLDTGTWAVEAGCPTDKSLGGFYFSFNDIGYYMEGALETSGSLDYYGNKLYSYEPITGIWNEEETMFIGEGRVLGLSEAVGNNVAIGLGRNYENDNYYNDMYVLELLSSAPAAFEDATDRTITVYPNPVATSTLFVVGNFTATDEVMYKVYDVQGKLQLSVKALGLGANLDTYSMNINALEAGVYFLAVTHEKQTSIRRFVKQ